MFNQINITGDKVKNQKTLDEDNTNFVKKIHESVNRRFGMPDRRKRIYSKGNNRRP